MTDLDFLPPQYHLARTDRQGRRRLIWLLVTLVVAMVAWMHAHAAIQGKLERQISEVDQQRTQVRIHRVRAEQLASQWARLKEREALMGLLVERISFAGVLASLSRAAPDSVVLHDVKYEALPGVRRTSPGAGVPAPTDRAGPGSTTRPSGPVAPALTVTGLAADAAHVGALAAGMSADPVFQEVTTQIGKTSIVAERRAVPFEIACRLHPEWEARP